MTSVNKIRHHWLHVFIWLIGRTIANIALGRKYNFTTAKYRPAAKNYLVLANHVTHLDPFLVAQSFPRHMYYVASEHLLRWKVGRLMMLLFQPILRIKSKTEANTAMEILRRLRCGYNVCIFIEGERTYGGCTEYIPASAAHLAKLCDSTIVTYRLERAYFSEPRWAKTIRRGRMTARLVNCYTPEELKKMTRDEVLFAIRRDLYIDAYEEQAQEPLAYRGKRLAEHLETALFICPACGRIGKLRSRDDRFWCECGMDLRYTEYGYLESAGCAAAPFSTVRDWYRWQQEELARYAAAHLADTGSPLLGDGQQMLYRGREHDRENEFVGEGYFAMYSDRVEFAAPATRLVIPLENITNVSCHEQMLLSFSSRGNLYELKSAYPRSAVKYQMLFRVLQNISHPDKEN